MTDSGEPRSSGVDYSGDQTDYFSGDRDPASLPKDHPARLEFEHVSVVTGEIIRQMEAPNWKQAVENIGGRVTLATHKDEAGFKPLQYDLVLTGDTVRVEATGFKADGTLGDSPEGVETYYPATTQASGDALIAGQEKAMPLLGRRNLGTAGAPQFAEGDRVLVRPLGNFLANLDTIGPNRALMQQLQPADILPRLVDALTPPAPPPPPTA